MKHLFAIAIAAIAGCGTFYCPGNEDTVADCDADYRAIDYGDREDFDAIDERCIDAIRKSESWCDQDRDADRETRHSAWERTLK